MEKEMAGMAAKNNNIKLLAIIFLLLAQTGKIYPQFNFYSSVDSYVDDNIYSNYLGVSDFINSISFGAGYDIVSESNDFEIYYEGNFNYYTENNFRSSSLNKAGIVNSYYINGNNPLNIGVNYSWRNYKEDYQVYDWNNLSLYANYRQYLSEDDFVLTGYIFNTNNYKNLSIFSYNESKGFLKFRFAFPSKTSLLIGVEGAYKDYIENYDILDIGESASQLRAFIQGAQSLGEKTGLNIYAQLRKNINSGSRYININDYTYYEEEILYDQYSNEGYNGGIKLTQMLNPTLILNAFLNYAEKNYVNLPAADLEGNDLDYSRKDNQFRFGLGLEANLGKIVTGLFGKVNWTSISNDSNDPFYNYKNQIFSLGLEFNF